MSEDPKLDRKDSGPVVIHVSSPIRDQQTLDTHNNNTMLRRKRRTRPLILIVGFLVILVAISIFLESHGQLNNTSPGGASQTIKKKETKGSKRTSKSTHNFDVNAPPIPKEQRSFWDTDSVLQKEDNDRSSFTFWGQQANRLTGLEPSVSTKKTKKTKKSKKKLHPFPIIDDEEDRIPQGATGAVISAADVLLCRESVIDYVINATDLKDECDGLKKAFTKNCADEEEPPPSSRRRLPENEQSTLNQQENPVIIWQYRLYQMTHSVRRWWKPKSMFFMAEEEIIKEWDDAAFEVAQGWDSLSDDDSLPTSSHRRLIEERSNEGPSDTLVVPLNNKTTPTPKEKPKLLSLAMPTNLHHMSEKTYMETLMLKQEENLIASVKAAQNQTNATKTKASADAAASVKAVSDTTDLVSSVLNDPLSVEARTCCASILNVFHENCNVDEDDELSDSRLFIVVAVIAFCGLVKSLIRHFHIRWLPEAAGCILVGVASGWALSYFPHHDLSFDGNWFLRILVPPIVFEAALSIDKRSFNRHIVPILFYALFGTLISTALTAIIVHEGSKYYHGYCETIPYIEALTFGALISSIDPIAVLSVLSNMGMTDTDTIYVVIFGESLLNDGIAIVLFETLVHFLDDDMHVDGHAVSAAAIHFLVVAIGSLLVGLASGICCTVYYWMMHGCQTPLVEILMFCCWALLPYYVCDGIEWSGIVAVVTAGFVMDIYVVGSPLSEETSEVYEVETSYRRSSSGSRERRRRPIFSGEGHLSKEAKTHIGFVTEIIATMMETVIFAYLGLFLFSSRYHWNFYHTVIAILACCVSRAIMIPSLSTLANWITKAQQSRANWHSQELPQQPSSRQNNPAGVVINKKMQLVLWFAGLRGAMSFALVENIPLYDAVTGEGTRLKSELKAMTSASIIFTVFVLGGCTYYMMEGLGMTPQASGGNKHQHPSMLEREMEMIGLLSKRSHDEGREDVQWEGDNATDVYETKVKPAPSNSNIFRQRVQAL